MFGAFVRRQEFVWLTSPLGSPRLEVALTNRDEETRVSQKIYLLDEHNHDLLLAQLPWS